MGQGYSLMSTSTGPLPGYAPRSQPESGDGEPPPMSGGDVRAEPPDSLRSSLMADRDDDDDLTTDGGECLDTSESDWQYTSSTTDWKSTIVRPEMHFDDDGFLSVDTRRHGHRVHHVNASTTNTMMATTPPCGDSVGRARRPEVARRPSMLSRWQPSPEVENGEGALPQPTTDADFAVGAEGRMTSGIVSRYSSRASRLATTQSLNAVRVDGDDPPRGKSEIEREQEIRPFYNRSSTSVNSVVEPNADVDRKNVEPASSASAQIQTARRTGSVAAAIRPRTSSVDGGVVAERSTSPAYRRRYTSPPIVAPRSVRRASSRVAADFWAATAAHESPASPVRPSSADRADSFRGRRPTPEPRSRPTSPRTPVTAPLPPTGSHVAAAAARRRRSHAAVVTTNELRNSLERLLQRELQLVGGGGGSRAASPALHRSDQNDGPERMTVHEMSVSGIRRDDGGDEDGVDSKSVGAEEAIRRDRRTPAAAVRPAASYDAGRMPVERHTASPITLGVRLHSDHTDVDGTSANSGIFRSSTGQSANCMNLNCITGRNHGWINGRLDEFSGGVVGGMRT